MGTDKYDAIQKELGFIRTRIRDYVLKLDFRDHTELGEHKPTKMPKDIDKLQEMVNPVNITRDASDLIFKLNGHDMAIGKLMALHTRLAECVYLKRTHADMIKQREQARIDIVAHEAAEEERRRKRQEEDEIAMAQYASLQELAGIKPKPSKPGKRRRGG